jgi:DNA ligase-1
MFFSTFCTYLNNIRSTRSRIEKKNILIELFKTCTPHESKIAAYFIQGTIKGIFQHETFGISEKTLLVIASEYFQLSEEEIIKLNRSTGDIGTTYNILQTKKNIVFKEYSIENIHHQLYNIASIEGKDSCAKKHRAIINSIHFLDPISIQFFIRIVIGIMGIGVSDKTLLESCNTLINNQITYKDLEIIYASYSDIGQLVYFSCENDIKNLLSIQPTIGIPIIPAAAERIKSLSEINPTISYIVQPKYDGMRIQAHIDTINKRTFFFSRNLLNVSHMFIPLQKTLLELCKQQNISSCILDGELVVYDTITKEYKSFQETISKKRIHNIDQNTQEENPIHYIVFDILILNNQNYMKKSYRERFEILNTYFPPQNNTIIYHSHSYIINNMDIIEQLYKKYHEKKYEGIMIKDVSSLYKAGKRSDDWLKWKIIETDHLSDTIDLVIIGYFFGKGKRTELGIGALLCAIYDPEKEQFLTITKIGTGLSQDIWKKLGEQCQLYTTSQQPHDVVCPKSLMPDVWCNPHVLITVSADAITESTEHSSGFSLRFPRMIKIINDKLPIQATTINEIKLFKQKNNS